MTSSNNPVFSSFSNFFFFVFFFVKCSVLQFASPLVAAVFFADSSCLSVKMLVNSGCLGADTNEDCRVSSPSQI